MCVCSVWDGWVAVRLYGPVRIITLSVIQSAFNYNLYTREITG